MWLKRSPALCIYSCDATPIFNKHIAGEAADFRHIDSEVIKRRHPHILSLAKDVKLGFYTVPPRNRIPGCHVAVYYTTDAPRQLPDYTYMLWNTMKYLGMC